MQNAETVLDVLRERGRRGLPLEGIYRQLFNPQLYLLAYGRIYSNKGAMTPGADAETADGMTTGKIERIIDAVRHERYRFRPVRRRYIPKKDGKQRPLGLPSWSDKLLGEVIRLLLEAYYEPQFSDHSHGYRPGRGCHTALREVARTWTGTSWFIEGDISHCFDRLDSRVMLETLGEKIHDNRLLRLIGQMLAAGYLEDWVWNATLSGVPQVQRHVRSAPNDVPATPTVSMVGGRSPAWPGRRAAGRAVASGSDSQREPPLPGCVAVWKASRTLCERAIFGAIGEHERAGGGGRAGGRAGCRARTARGRSQRWGFAREREVRMLHGVRSCRPRRTLCGRCDATHVLSSGVVGAAPARWRAGDRRGAAPGGGRGRASHDRTSARAPARHGAWLAARSPGPAASSCATAAPAGRRHWIPSSARSRSAGSPLADAVQALATAARAWVASPRPRRLPVGADRLAHGRPAVRATHATRRSCRCARSGGLVPHDLADDQLLAAAAGQAPPRRSMVTIALIGA